MNEYSTRPHGHLRRARARLDEPQPESLSYAALELRCGIEMRLKEYLAFSERGNEPDAVKLDWQINKLRARVTDFLHRSSVASVKIDGPDGQDRRGQLTDSLGPVEDRVIKFTLASADTGAVLRSFYYTPVTRALAKRGEALGQLLHSRWYYEQSNPWWAEQRASLEETYRMLKQSLTGSLISLPEFDPATGWPRKFMLDPESPMASLPIGEAGRIGLTIKLFKDFPEDELSLDWD